MSELVVVTGGAGYIGALVCERLLESGRRVRALDALMHGQEEVAESLHRAGIEVLRGDIRDARLRSRALAGADAVVHLAAIVGDPACARDPELADEVNVQGTHALLSDACAAEVGRFIFASTCSNYGRMKDPTIPIDEQGQLAPISLYSEQKVALEKHLLGRRGQGPAVTCLRFATVYGAAPRMRFDLTVNEFTRELWNDRELEVFGEQFWRPYVHVRDVGRAVRTVLDAPLSDVASEVYNVGRSGENYRKLDLTREIQRQTPRGKVSFVHRDEDPRDYKVSFDKIRARLGFQTELTVPDGIAELLAALDSGAYPDPYDGRYRNTP